MIQSVIKNEEKIISQVEQKSINYSRWLITTIERKNYLSISRCNDVDYKEVLLTEEEAEVSSEELQNKLLKMAKRFATRTNHGYLVIDFTLLIKSYSSSIDGVTYDRDGCSNRVEKGLSLGFAAWSNSQITIPVAFNNWRRKIELADSYKSKIGLAKEMILYLKEKISFETVLMDGAFASLEMITFCIGQRLYFALRIARNRKVCINGISEQLQYHPSLRLYKNERSKTVKGYYKGIELYFTAEKRKKKDGKWEVVFIVSNIDLPPKQTVNLYKKRNLVESCFRTKKQYIGLLDCQST